MRSTHQDCQALALDLDQLQNLLCKTAVWKQKLDFIQITSKVPAFQMEDNKQFQELFQRCSSICILTVPFKTTG